MNTRKPFLYCTDKLQKPVSAFEASRRVMEDRASCHNFRVNPEDAIPSLKTVQADIDALVYEREDGDAFLMQRLLKKVLDSVQAGAYAVAALLADPQQKGDPVLEGALNKRIKGHEEEYLGHAETRLVKLATPILQRERERVGELVHCVTLSPCSGCFGPMIDTHVGTTVIGSIDPQVGAAFTKGRDLQLTAGIARQQVIQSRKLQFRFPEIADEKDLLHILELCWDVFHASRNSVHRSLHGSTLRESNGNSREE